MGTELVSLSSHSKRSSHGKDEFLSVTVRKDDPSQKAGIMLESEANGRIRVTNIAKNGLFAGSEIEIGDIVLSINGKRLAKGEGPDVLVDVIKKAESKVTVVVKKGGMAPRVPERPKKDISQVQDNNVKMRDSYYAGQSKFREDGSLAFGTDAQTPTAAEPVIACTISANKEDQRGDEIDTTAGITFVVQRKLLFISAIAKDSVFTATDLEVGDRVLSINDCNFRAFADAKLAFKMVAKAINAVTLIVEKGVEGFTPLPYTEADEEDNRNNTSTRPRRRSRDGKRPSSASQRSPTDEAKPLRRMLKNTDTTKAEVSSDLESTDSVSGESFEDDIVADLGLPLSKSDYKEVVIAAPKSFSAQDVGVAFSSKKNRYIVVKTIEPTSIFANTSLEPGDIILEINDVDFRGVSDKLEAMKTCRKTKEVITMLVLKEDAKFKQQEFNLDASSSNLEWQ